MFRRLWWYEEIWRINWDPQIYGLYFKVFSGTNFFIWEASFLSGLVVGLSKVSKVFLFPGQSQSISTWAEAPRRTFTEHTSPPRVLSRSVVSDSVTPWTVCSPPGSSVHGILQARILEWVARSSFRVSSQPRDQTQVSHIAGRFFTIWATREALSSLLAPNLNAVWKYMLWSWGTDTLCLT